MSYATEAVILAVGSELLGTDRLDTNSLRLAQVLEDHGVDLVGKAVVGDDEDRLTAAVEDAVSRAGLVLVTGGLGPTADDLTRPAVARALGREVFVDEDVVREIRDRFAAHGMTMPEVNRRQGQVIHGADVIPNRRGSAPGLRLTADDATLFLFPGPPHELEGMIESHLIPWLAERGDGTRGEQRVLKLASTAESTVEEWLTPAYDEMGRHNLTVLASPGDIQVRFRARGDAETRARKLDEMEARLRELLGEAVYGSGADATLEGTVGELLRAAGKTVVTAESCTGGLLAERLTRVAGSSAWYLGSVVTYTNELKARLLGVSEDDLARHGAVSEPVARAMATGARELLGADYALAVTGIAGPGGGSDDKPVGTVHVALATPEDVRHYRVQFPGDRKGVRRRTAQFGLEALRRRLVAGDREPRS